MTSVFTSKQSPEFINIEVTVVHASQLDEYVISCVPEMVTVHSPDAVINYQITNQSPSDIQFAGMTVLPDDTNQLSAASISVNGKMLTFSNANTEKVMLNVTLQFHDADGAPFAHDPQIQNDPSF